MNSSGEDSTINDILLYNDTSYSRKSDISFGDHIADFERLRISAITKAAEISPLVKEVTIGPNSPVKKEEPKEPEIESKQDIVDEASLIQDKIREDLRYTLIMKEYETKLQEASENIFNNLIAKMIDKRTEEMEKYRKQQAEECKRKVSEMRKLQILKELQANDNYSILEKARLDYQRSQAINRQRIENMNKALEEQNKATARFAAITDSHTKICISYNEITEILNTDPYAKLIYNKYVPPINSVVTNISTIMEMCTSNTATDKEVKQAETLSQYISNLKDKILQDLTTVKQEEKNKQDKEEELLKQKEIEQKKAEDEKTAQIQKAAEEETKRSGPMFYSQKNYAYYTDLKTFLETYELQYKDLLENTNFKKFRFDCQKAVNTPVNAISSVSGMHIRDKFDKLSKLLKGERVQVLDTYVMATQHPQGLAYCTALLAKKIVRQGDLLVSSKPEAAFPLAAVTVALWSQFPEFGRLLEAYFHRFCPYLVPMFLPQKEGQTDKEFYLSRGYTYNDEGVVEKQDKFLKRMSGIFRLRCAIWIASTPKFINTPNPHGLQHAWRWLSSFINLKPEPDISATLLHDFFTVCGSEFYKCYGKQFTKIIRLISNEYLGILQNIDEGGPKTRLEVFLQNLLKTGFIPPPSGVLNPNTW